MMVLLAAQEGEWDELDAAIRRFQQAMMAMKYAPKPVVAAPFGMTLGGGCEVALHAARVQASAETYMGLVESGRRPDSGGRRVQGDAAAARASAKRAFELIGYRQGLDQRRGRARTGFPACGGRHLDESANG